MSKKMLISIALIIVMLLNYILPISLAAESTTDEASSITASTNGAITFNGALYDGLKDNLVKAGIQGEFNDAQRTMKLSQEDINKVTTLKLSNYGISDLTGLDTFKNVTYVDLSANELDSDSNLEVLNSLNLNYLDLSSNGISDVSMITNIDSIETLNLHNQKFNLVEIIEVDTEVESNQITEVTYALPQIFQYGGRIKLDWLLENDYAADGSVAPHAIWSNFDGKNLKIKIGESTDTGYTPYYGMTKISLEVDSSTNELYNSKINLFYITISSEERGIIFKDNNLYKAVKEQLTKSQTTNTDLTKYTDEANLYNRAYDDQKVLIIDISTLINKIPSLILTDKKIEDLTGIESFVGLERELDLEGNYIENIDKIIELKANKLIEEANLQTKVNEQISSIKESVDTIDSANEAIESENKKVLETQKSITEIKAKIAALTSEISSSSDDTTSKQSELVSKQNELNTKQDELNESLKVIATNQNIINTQTSVLQRRMARLYEIYQKSYKFTKVATVELDTLTDDEFSSLTYQEAKSLFEKQLSRYTSIESSLSSYESEFIINFYSIPTVTNATVTGTTGTTTTTVEIESPISTYFKSFEKNNEDWTLTDIKSFLTNVKYISSVLEMMDYCTIERLYNGTTACYAEDYIAKTTEERNWAGQSTTDLEQISANLSTIKNAFKSAYEHNCDGTVTFSVSGDIYSIAKRFANTTSSEVSEYVKIPMLKILNIKRNLIESINGIESLNELQELYVENNELVTVEGVNWSKMTDLKILDLSYNSISKVNCLEEISSLVELDLSKNLISGAYNFDISVLPKLKKLNMSYNEIDDIELLEIQLEGYARDAGYSSIREYLEAKEIDIKFYGQILSMELNLVKMGTTTYVDLPNIFRQAESLDNVRTSFGTNSIFGNVTNDGKQVLLDTSKLGDQISQVSIVDTKYLDPGICSQTYCVIKYTVTAQEIVEPGNSGSIETPTTPDDSNETEEPSNPTTPDVSTTPEDVEYGYEVSGESLKGVSPKTTISTFASNLTSDYNVLVVKENDEDTLEEVNSGYVGTGMMAIVYVDEDNIIGVYEIVVKGDVNGDGVANATDSNLIKAYRSEIMNLTGVYKEAADINQDGVINAIDSRLLLYHRAEIKGYVL